MARFFILAVVRCEINNACDMNTLIERIDARLAELGISRSRASLMAGLNVKFILSIAKHPNRSPRAENLEALAKVLGVPVEWLIRGNAEPEAAGDVNAYLGGVSVNGSAPAEGGDSQSFSKLSADDLALQNERRARRRKQVGIPVLSGWNFSINESRDTSDPIEYIDISEKFERIRDVFALYVEDDAMAPAYRAGDLIILHPARPPRSGDDAVFVLSDGGDCGQGGKVIVASIVSAGGEEYQLRRYSPAQDFSLSRSEVRAVFVVMAVLRG